jgi:hypothetical protein
MITKMKFSTKRPLRKPKLPVYWAPGLTASLRHAGLMTIEQEVLFLEKWREIEVWNDYGRFRYDEGE